jgi:serine/threonine protein kinase
MPELRPRIGRYQITRTLGAGAMGKVYLADDPLLKRRVAIKVVQAMGEEREIALERFKREAEISAQLNHPNVVTVYDVGEEPTLGPFIAMEFVEGNSLGKLIRDGGLEPETCLGILIQAMRALRAAHRHAIVHRDVKPDNILVSEDGRVKLMDFGIARTMEPRSTAAGEFLGSPAYSAPELLRGDEPTPGSDRYAFAVTAFELLTGQLPHPGNSVGAVITHALNEPPAVPLSMPPRVGYVFRKALDSDAEERYESLPAFLMDLVDAYPLEENARTRVLEQFRREDHAGDIVPIRRLKTRPLPFAESPLAAHASGGARMTPARPAPVYIQPPPVKIELEAEALNDTRAAQRTPPPRPRDRKGPEPFTLVKWIIVVLIVGQAFWWILGHLKQVQF